MNTIQKNTNIEAGAADVVVAASTITYQLEPMVSVLTIPASGGDSIITALFKTYEDGVLVSAVPVMPEVSLAAKEGFSANKNVVSALSRGTLEGAVRSVEVTVSYSFSVVSAVQTLECETMVKQAANTYTIGEPSTRDLIVKSNGGTFDLTNQLSQRLTYSSGASQNRVAVGVTDCNFTIKTGSLGSVNGNYLVVSSADRGKAEVRAEFDWNGATYSKTIKVYGALPWVNALVRFYGIGDFENNSVVQFKPSKYRFDVVEKGPVSIMSLSYVSLISGTGISYSEEDWTTPQGERKQYLTIEEGAQGYIICSMCDKPVDLALYINM